MAVPSVVTLLVDHMDLQAPILDERMLGSSMCVQKHCELLDEIVERCAQLLGCTSEVLMARIYSADTTGLNSVCCEGPGVGQSCIYRGGSLESQASEHILGYNGRSLRGRLHRVK